MRRIQLAALAAVLLAWELAAELWPSTAVPAPHAIAARLAALAADGSLGAAVLRSLARLAQGFGLAVILGVPLGLVLARRAALRATLRPAAVGLQALPSVSWLPLAVLWFGPSEAAIVLVVVMGSLLAIALATEDAVLGIPPVLLQAAGTLGLRGARLWLGVLLPAALPGVLTGTKLGWSFAWRALMAGELLVPTGGLGRLLHEGRGAQDPAALLAVIATIVLVGAIVDGVLFRFLEVRTRRRWGLAEAPAGRTSAARP